MTTLRKWPKISKLLISDGTGGGVVEVDSVAGFYSFQKVTIISDTQQILRLEIKEIVSENKVRLGSLLKKNEKAVDLSSYLTADNAILSAAAQKMFIVDEKTIIQEVFERGPVDAIRTINVDEEGDLNSIENPSSVQISDGEYVLKINPDGSITIKQSVVKVPNIINIAVPTANTEIAYVIPVTATRYSFKIRDAKAKVKASYSIGQSGVTYWTINRGCEYIEENIDATSGITLYFQATHGGVVAEIKYWE